MTQTLSSTAEKASFALTLSFNTSSKGLDLEKLFSIHNRVTDHINKNLAGEKQRDNIKEFSQRLLHCYQEHAPGKAIFEENSFELSPQGIMHFLLGFKYIPGIPDLYSASKNILQRVKYHKKTELPDLQIARALDPSAENIAKLIIKLFELAAHPDYQSPNKNPNPEILENFEKQTGIHLVPQNFIGSIKKGHEQIKKLATQGMASCVYAFAELSNYFTLAHLEHDLKASTFLDFLVNKLREGEKILSFKIGRGVEEHPLSMKALEQIMHALNHCAQKTEDQIYSPPNPNHDSVEFALNDDSNLYTPNYYDKTKQTPCSVNEAIADSGINNMFAPLNHLVVKEISSPDES